MLPGHLYPRPAFVLPLRRAVLPPGRGGNRAPRTPCVRCRVLASLRFNARRGRDRAPYTAAAQNVYTRASATATARRPCAYVSAMFICSIASRVATRVVMWCSRRLVARLASCFEIRATYAACAGCRAGQRAQARARVRFTVHLIHRPPEPVSSKHGAPGPGLWCSRVMMCNST